MPFMGHDYYPTPSRASRRCCGARLNAALFLRLISTPTPRARRLEQNQLGCRSGPCQNGVVARGPFRQVVLLIAAFGAGYLLAHTESPDSSTRTPRRVSRPVMVTPLVNELEEEAERLKTEVAILQAKLEEERSQSQSDEPASEDVVVADMNGDGLRDIYWRVPPTWSVLERHKAAAGLYVNLGNGSFLALGADLLRTQGQAQDTTPSRAWDTRRQR